jgi:transposase
LDETFGTTAMTRLYGWGPRGQRVVDAVPHGHWTTTTFVCGLRPTGLCGPMVIDGAMTGPHFEAYLKQVLGPELRPGDLVVMDNLRTHTMASVAGILAEFKARPVYLPPYSPDLNPIEQAFSQVKSELRSQELRTVDALWHAFGRSLDWVTTEQARNYFRHAGYKLE